MSSNDVQPDKQTQTTNTNINNQDVTKESSTTTSADNDKSSLSKVQTTDVNKHAPEISTQESTKASSSQVQPITATETSTTDANKHTPTMSSPTDLKPTDTTETSTTQIPDSGVNKQSTESQPAVTTEPSTSQIPDSDVNKQSSTVSTEDHGNSLPNKSQPTVTTEPSTSQIPDSDVNKQATTVSTEDHGNSLPTESQPTVTTEPSTSQIPDSDVNKQATTVSTEDHGNSLPNKSQPTVTTEPSTSQIPDSDVNKQATTVSTEDHGNSLPTETQQTATSKPSTSQVPDSDANKQDTTVSSRDSPKNPTPKVEDEIASADQSITADNEAKEDKSSKSKRASDDKPTPDVNPTPEQDRKHLLTLIGEELKFVKKTYPKLGEHQKHIKEETDKALEEHKKLEKDQCDLMELKDLKRSVTKLKLQIPAKYRTYDETDKQKYQKLFLDRGLFSAKLLKQLPRLHDELFNESLICKTIHQRYNDLRLELKLCLLCFSVFPENVEISRRLMVYWWIAEGFILEEDDTGRTVEDHANEFFTELMDKDFIEPVSRSPDRMVSACKMQPMIRAALVIIADKLKFFDFDEYGNPKDFGKFDEIESPEEMPAIHPLGDPREFFDFFNEKRMPIEEPIKFIDSEGNPIPFAACPEKKDNKDENQSVVDRNGKKIDTSKPHYFYRKKNITTKSYKACLMGSGLSKGLSWEKLHMLFNVKDDILEFKLEWFLKMKNLNLLFLGRWQSLAAHHIEVEDFKFKESLEHMKHMRFFSLQGVSRIDKLPESISKLESLLILDLRACHNLEVIPKTIGLLKHLTHLDMSECYLLKDLPKEISSLESLQVLKGFVVVDSPNVCTLQDLKKLENLRKLSMYTHMKDFPRESHRDALQKLEALRKLTILWGGHESPKSQNGETKKMDADKKKSEKLGSKLPNMFRKTKRVEGSIRRMNAFNNSTLGSRLEKLDLKCFPHKATPDWLTPGNLKKLKKLYIRGGLFSDLGQYQDIYDCDGSPDIPKETWNNVKVLRLKYLTELKMEWRELRNLFPEMTYLEKVKCPRVTMFPCNERGVWMKPSTTSG